MSNYLRTDETMEKKLYEFIAATSSQSSAWWSESMAGTAETRRSRLDYFRLRYDARRSVASLRSDLKTQPFLRAANVGVGIEQIMGEWLVSDCLANTVDLDPPIQAYDPATRSTNEVVEGFYTEQYVHEMGIRTVYEALVRELFTVGGAISKWEPTARTRQREKTAWVFLDPATKQPLMAPNPQSGQPEPIAADPQMPKEQLPTTPDGRPVLVGRMSNVETVHQGWLPRLRVRTVEQIDVPTTAVTQDPDTWDYIHETYTVNAWWFLGREGEMYDGRIPEDRLKRLWQALGVTPEEAWRNPNGQLVRPVEVRESHLKFPATSTGEPVELIVLSLPKHKFIISWRLSPFTRRPYFNHQVWHRTNHWLGKGIPETVFGLRNAMDALLCQDLNAGELYNQPPLLISSLAGLNDDTFELAGPGAVWYLRDINGVKFLPPPIRNRDPITMLNWLVSMAQRVWGVTDFNLNAPTSSLSPNISTAHGVEAVRQQGNIKFGHFIRNIESIRTQELQMMHQLYRDMWTGEYQTVDAAQQPVMLTRQTLPESVRLRAVGDGIQTNPQLRQQRLTELMLLYAKTQNPFVVGDPDVLYELTSQINDGADVALPIKKPQAMEELRMASQLVQTPTVQHVLPMAMEELKAMQIIAAHESQKQSIPSPDGGTANVRMAPAMA